MASPKNVFAHFFDSNITLLKLSALWIYDSKTSWKIRYSQLLYNIFWAIYLYLIYFPTECLYLTETYNDLNGFIRVLRDVGNHIASIIKATNWYLMRHHILELLEILQSGEFYYEPFNDFQPELIVRKYKNNAAKWAKILFHLINTICFCMFASGLFVFVFNKDQQYRKVGDRLVYMQKLPVNVISPFGSGTRIQFFFTFVYVIIALTFYGWMITALDSLFTTIMSCLSAHLIIVQGAIKTMRPRCEKRINYKINDMLNRDKILEKEVMLEMRTCIRHLQTLFKVSQKLEYIYNIQTFFQTMISLGEICFCLYLLSITLDENTGNEVTYLFSTGFQLLLYCWFGNTVTEASIGVNRALYDSDWLSANVALRKLFILTMTRMQKPIYVTIGKITPLTFTTFLTIARGAYSFFTFLKQRG